MSVDLILRGGSVVMPSGVVTIDIAIDGGVVVGLGEKATMPSARRTLEVDGAYVLPGAIDAHVHFNTFTAQSDSLKVAAQSGAYGGITTLLGFLLLREEMPVTEGIKHFIAEGERESVVDFAFHLILRPRHTLTKDIDDARLLGVTSFKMFMAYARRGFMMDDGLLFQAFDYIAATGGLAMVHAENGTMIDRLEEAALAAGRTTPLDFVATRPAVAEAEAINRAIRFAEATQCPLYVVHVSSHAGLDEIAAAKARRSAVYGETCPQYLLLDSSVMARLGPIAKIAPPLRSVDDNAALWEGLRRGHLDVISSDHAPYTSAAKAVGWDDVFQAPFGAPGIETLLLLTYTAGVHHRGFSLAWLVRVLSEMPARLFGLYPRKGVIAIGSDADLVVIDPARRGTIHAHALHSSSDFTLFEGVDTHGGPLLSMVRGQVVLADEELHINPGYGRYLARATQRRKGDSEA